MRVNRNSVAGLLAASAAVTAAIAPVASVQAQSVTDSNLSDVSAQTVGDCSTVTIKFNKRVQILSHFPDVSGRELRVQMRFLDSSGKVGRESLRTPSGVPSLRSIAFDDVNGRGPTLSLGFNRDMQFSVAAGQDADTILISISEIGAGANCTVARLEPDSAIFGGADGKVPASQPAAGQPAASGLYVVNLLSQPRDIGDLPAAQGAKVSDLLLYETRFEREGQMWHRLRAGFFNSRADAEAALSKLLPSFPEAWVVKVTAQERQQGVTTSRATSGGRSAAVATPVGPTVQGSPEDTASTAKAIQDAETAIKGKDNDRAIQLLTRALAYPANENTARAQELLGLTRERKNQTAQARAEYEEYLRRYPTGEGADRVRQRLASLDASVPTSDGQVLRNPNGPRKTASNGWRWGVRGSFSQFYFRDQSTNTTTTTPINPNDPNIDPFIDNAVNLNQLLTNADLTITGGNDRTQVLMRGAGSYTKSFRAKTPIKDPVTQNIVGFRTGDVKTISALYIDAVDHVTNISSRLGRQTRNNSGVLGRFDGGLIGWQAKPRLKFNAVAGTPVLRARDLFIRSDRFFYGASVDIGARNDKLQTTLYWYDERSPGLIDRQALGAEARYLKGSFNAYAIFDYDVHHSRVGLGLLTLNYTLKDQSSLSVTADYRLSPLLNSWTVLQSLSATDVFPGRTAAIETLSELRGRFTDAQIYQMARDNTQLSKSLTVSYSRPLTKKLQTNLDFTMTHTGGSPGSTRLFPGSTYLPIIDSTGTEYYYGAQLVGSGMIFANDIYILGGRYADTPRARTYNFDINGRIPVNTKFRLSPRARYGFRQNKTDAGSFHQFQPSMRLNFYPFKQSEVEIEVGGNFTKTRTVLGGAPSTSTEKGILLSAGYRIDF